MVFVYTMIVMALGGALNAITRNKAAAWNVPVSSLTMYLLITALTTVLPRAGESRRLAVGLLGAGLGPTLLGVASDFFAGQAFASGDFIASCPGGMAPPGAEAALDAACRGASTQGLRMSLLCAALFLPWAAVHFLLASRTLKRDLVSAPANA
jgi:hypothetical protein